METYRSGHNGADSKHSRVCHAPIFETPLFIGVYAECLCTFRKPHLAVFSQFGIKALPLQFNMETYRSGHNGADSKSVREQSPASSNLAVSAKDSLKVLSFKEFSLFIPRQFLSPSHLLSCSRYQCGYRYSPWCSCRYVPASPESFSSAHRLQEGATHSYDEDCESGRIRIFLRGPHKDYNYKIEVFFGGAYLLYQISVELCSNLCYNYLSTKMMYLKYKFP